MGTLARALEIEKYVRDFRLPERNIPWIVLDDMDLDQVWTHLFQT